MVVSLSGEYDISSVEELRRAIQRAQTDGDPVVDFSDVRFADSMCVLELLTAAQQRKRDGLRPLTVVAGDNRFLQRLFTLCGVYEACNVVNEMGHVVRSRSDRRLSDDRRVTERRCGVLV
jgi:anti-anti-sigma factor